MSKTHEILLERRRQVQAEIAPLKAELKQIEVALAAINGENRNAGRGRYGRSIGDQVLKILQRHPNGMRTKAIVERLNEEFGREIANNNASWHLSHLKSEGRVVLERSLWRIPSTKNKAPDADTSSASLHHR